MWLIKANWIWYPPVDSSRPSGVYFSISKQGHHWFKQYFLFVAKPSTKPRLLTYEMDPEEQTLEKFESNKIQIWLILRYFQWYCVILSQTQLYQNSLWPCDTTRRHTSNAGLSSIRSNDIYFMEISQEIPPLPIKEFRTEVPAYLVPCSTGRDARDRLDPVQSLWNWGRKTDMGIINNHEFWFEFGYCRKRWWRHDIETPSVLLVQGDLIVGFPSKARASKCVIVRDCDTLQWRHHGRDGVSNHQRLDCFINRLFRRRSKETSKLRVTGLCAGHDDVIKWKHFPRYWPSVRGIHRSQ